MGDSALARIEDKAKRTAEEMALIYDEDGWVLGSALQCIPVIGSAIDRAMSGVAAKVAQARIRETLDGLAAGVQQIGESKLDKEFIDSPEFTDHLRSLFEQVIRARDMEQREGLRHAFLRGALKGQAGKLFSTIAMSRASMCTAIHIRILREALRPHSPLEDGQFDRATMEEAFGSALSGVELEAVLNDLLIWQLINHRNLGSWEYIQGDRDKYVLTDFGRQFILFIAEPWKPVANG